MARPPISSLRLVLAFLVLCWANNGALASYERAKELYIQGAFETASAQARALKTADGYALAAQALLVEALFFMEDETRIGAFRRAHRLALAGLETDPDHIESHLQAAASLGLEARIKNSSRLGVAAREHLDAILAINPDHAKTLAASGGWNGEVIHRAGSLIAKIFYGAGRKAAIRNFERAITLRPDLPSLRIAYAKTLLRFPSRYRGQAIRLLKESLTLAPPDRLGALTQIYGRLILEAAERGEKSRLKALLDDVPRDVFASEKAALP